MTSRTLCDSSTSSVQITSDFQTVDQNLDWQIDALKKEGCERIYQEKISGTKQDRPELLKMMEALREGDTVIVCELTRFSRSTKDLFELADRIHGLGADIKSLKESWLNTTIPQRKLLFTIFAGVSQFERDLTYERTVAGLAAVRARGRLGGRPKSDPKAIEQAIAMYNAGTIPIKDILERTGISRAPYMHTSKSIRSRPNKRNRLCRYLRRRFL